MNVITKTQVDMNKFINGFILLIVVLLVCSCNMFSDNKEEPEQGFKMQVQKIVELPDSVKEKMIKQDSLAQNLITKIDTITEGLNSAKENIEELKQKTDSFKSTNSIWFSLIGLFCGIIAMIISFSKPKGLKENEIKSIIGEYFRYSKKINNINSKLAILEEALNNQTNSKKGNSVTSLEQRIAELERKVKTLSKTNDKTIEDTVLLNIGETNKSEDYIKKGYAPLNRYNFIINISDSNQEGCVFKISFISSNKGEFDLIALDKIKSCNGWEDVIEYTGRCTMEEASSYKLIKKGVIVKYDDQTWEVQDKLKIEITK